jgi:two-component system OmpR family sensor kinase
VSAETTLLPRQALTTRTKLAVVTPVVIGILGAVLALTQWPNKNFFIETRLWITLGVLGLLVAGAVAVPLVFVRASARARDQAAQNARVVAEEEHRRFLLRLDHELKNPVTAMQAGLANLAHLVGNGATPADASTTQALDSVSAQAQRLAALVADLRKLAELESRMIERAPVDLAQLLGEVNEAIAELPGAADRRIALTLPSAPWPLGTVPGDHDLLFIAVHNLLVNAVKFTQPGDTIEVRARDDGEQVVIEVADTGIGIPDHEVGQVWAELARGSAARGTPGMGLGLAMVRGIASRHGGDVWLRSRSGSGTVVGMGLPAT